MFEIFEKYSSYLNFKKKLNKDIIDTPLLRNSSYGTFKNQLLNDKKQHPETLLSDKYESLDYDCCENSLLTDAEKQLNYKNVKCTQFQRWVVMLLIGMATAIIACIIDISIDSLTNLIYYNTKWHMENMVEALELKSFNKTITSQTMSVYLLKPYAVWLFFAMAFALTPALLVVLIEPMASGSGISQIKCFLNGVKIPNIVRLKTLLIKIYGIIFAISSGLIIGKEGPMVHIGSIIGAGVSQGCSSTLKLDFGIFKNFRTDTEKRDFVSAGTAAGLSAAFGAPIGGLLLSLEEGASFWNQGLTWRIFFASLISTFTLNVVMSAYKGHPGELSNSGLINFGKLDDIYYNIAEVPIFIIMAVIGGLLGALFNFINIRLTLFRMRHIVKPHLKILEVAIVTLVTSSILFNVIYYSDSCVSLPTDREIVRPIKMFCNDDEYNSIATMLFQTAEHRIRGLFHDSPQTYDSMWLLVLFITWYMLACWTFGISVPSGIFIPSILIGATWGRLIGVGIGRLYPNSAWCANPSKFALLGAAVQLGGVVRMTLSLTVMLIEATGNITFGLVIMLCLMITKWIGDCFNEGVYDMHIHLLSIPFLGWEPPPLSCHITANRIMSHPVTTFRTVERVSTIIAALRSQNHNGYPLVDTGAESHRLSFGRFRGLILRSQLLIILLHKYSKHKILLKELSVELSRQSESTVQKTAADETRESDDEFLILPSTSSSNPKQNLASLQSGPNANPIISLPTNNTSNFYSYSCSPCYKWRHLDNRDFEPFSSNTDSTAPKSDSNDTILTSSVYGATTTKTNSNDLLRSMFHKKYSLQKEDSPQTDRNLLEDIKMSGQQIDESTLLTLKDFQDAYPRYFNINDIEFQDGIDSMDCPELIDLTPYCCKAPYTISYSATLPRVFKLFRALGLRHLTVVNEKNEVVGMITRKDVARFRWVKSWAKGAVQELKIYQES